MWVVVRVVAFWLVATMAFAMSASAQTEPSQRVLDVTFTPTKRAQLAIWIEDTDGNYRTTLMLTDLVARLGLGNRPGASQMNSGYRWPYGRRDGVLPIWGTRRANAPGAQHFRRVIFQNRYSEGRASRTTNDHSIDPYYCLSFSQRGSTKDGLDAVSCASANSFSSDRGRFVTERDVSNSYAEPFEDADTGEGLMLPLSLHSLYPPRRDSERCASTTCFDHPDVSVFREHALSVMPELDAITTATLQGDVERHHLFTLPSDLPDGDYVLWIEINTEGDYNDIYNDETLPTPTLPLAREGTTQPEWDTWAINYGYPYRGQPSVVFSVPFTVGGLDETSATTSTPDGAGSWDPRDPQFGQLGPLDTITDDPIDAPGSGADRLRASPVDGTRLTVTARAPSRCDNNQPPSAVSNLRVRAYPDFRHTHEWAQLSFTPATDDEGVFRYEVRIANGTMVDAVSFIELGVPAKSATTFSQELTIPVSDATTIDVPFGGMLPATTYELGVRAIDACNVPGEIVFTRFTTTEQRFTTVTPCFVATAAYGTPLATEIGALRRLRDRLMLPSATGRAVVQAYYRVGPTLAAWIAPHPTLRAIARALLSPVVWIASRLDPESK